LKIDREVMVANLDIQDPMTGFKTSYTPNFTAPDKYKRIKNGKQEL
jgi:hypothetical protein